MYELGVRCFHKEERFVVPYLSESRKPKAESDPAKRGNACARIGRKLRSSVRPACMSLSWRVRRVGATRASDTQVLSSSKASRLWASRGTRCPPERHDPDLCKAKTQYSVCIREGAFTEPPFGRKVSSEEASGNSLLVTARGFSPPVSSVV